MEHTRAEMCSPPDSVPFLQLMMKLVNAKKVVEVGVFTGTHASYPHSKCSGTRRLPVKCYVRGDYSQQCTTSIEEL